MKRWWLLIALLLSVGINVGILATLAFQPRLAGPAAIPATGGPPPADPLAGDPGVGPSDPLPREGRMPPVVERMADELHLEGEKREAFVEIQRAFFEQTLAARSGMARIQREIRREVTSEDPDRERADRLLAEAAADADSLPLSLAEGSWLALEQGGDLEAGDGGEGGQRNAGGC